MKRLRIAVGAIVISLSASIFANGPMPEDPAPTGSGTKMSPGREKWTRTRMGHLKRRRIAAGRQLEIPGGDNPFSFLNNPYVNGDDAELRRRDAIRRQREIDTIEFLALKKERGELTPAGQKKLNALIRHVQNR